MKIAPQDPAIPDDFRLRIGDTGGGLVDLSAAIRVCPNDPDRFYERRKTHFVAAQIDGGDTATHLSKAERDVQKVLQIGWEKWRSRNNAVELLPQIHPP
ncbi:MAG: hypothetical protein IH998_09555 [Proteobacteria bacterium]|nr:hypothetical protein [Pseudomonadota bacterium]